MRAGKRELERVLAEAAVGDSLVVL